MNNVKILAAKRIFFVSIILAAIVTPPAWVMAKNSAEKGVVSLALDETRRISEHLNTLSKLEDGLFHPAQEILKISSRGLFDIVEIYDHEGRKLGETQTPEGESIEAGLPRHHPPNMHDVFYESFWLDDGKLALRVILPLYSDLAEMSWGVGYFEGVKIIPQWQSEEIRSAAIYWATIAFVSALLCGLAIYPFIITLATDNLRKAETIVDSHISMLEAFGRAIAKRDSETGAHNFRVAWIAARIGEELGLSSAQMRSLIAGSFLHDIGKIGIPDPILLKPGKLTDIETKVMREHVALGEEIVQDMQWIDGAQQVVAAHHEKWDGTGYPRQLSGTSIPLAARIFAVADVYDALASKRPYKEPMDFPEIMNTLRNGSGTHFDPSVLSAFEGIALDISNALQGTTEDETKKLLESKTRKYFEI